MIERTRLRLEYFDQNEGFGAALPAGIDGVCTGVLSSAFVPRVFASPLILRSAVSQRLRRARLGREVL